ncbi:MAG: hypothetical protein AAB368_12345, partial [bacterium]
TTGIGTPVLTKNGSIITSGDAINNLAVGAHLFNCTIAQSENYTYAENSSVFVISTATTGTTLTISPASPISYGTQSNFSCSNSVGLPVTLYINGVASTNNANITRTANEAGYNVTCIATGNESYDSSQDNETYIINKASATGTIAGTGTQSYPYTSNVSYSETNTGDSDINYTLYRDGVLTNFYNSGTFNAGVYNYTLNTTGGENYSSGRLDTELLTISQNTTNMLLVVFNTSDSVEIGTVTSAEGSGCPAELTCKLYRNGVEVSNPDVQSLGIGVYNYTYNTSGNTNYAAMTETQNLTVSAD